MKKFKKRSPTNQSTIQKAPQARTNQQKKEKKKQIFDPKNLPQPIIMNTYADISFHQSHHPV